MGALAAQLGLSLPASTLSQKDSGGLPVPESSVAARGGVPEGPSTAVCTTFSAVMRALLPEPVLLEQLLLAFEFGLVEVLGRGLQQVRY